MANGFFNHLANIISNGTRATAAQVNNIANEIAAGFDKLPSETDLKRGTTNYAADTGSANAYAVSLTYAPASYTDGMEVIFKAANANTGACSMNVNSLGVKSIKRADGTDPAASEIPASKITTLRYNSTSGVFEIQNGAGYASSAAASATAAASSASSASSSASSASSSASSALSSANSAAAYLAAMVSDYQAFTSSGTWTKPSGLTGNELALVQLWGGGGGGYSGVGGGGGGGCYAEGLFPVSQLSATESVTIGSGGSAGSSGGSSSFGALLSSPGGSVGGSSNGGGGAGINSTPDSTGNGGDGYGSAGGSVGTTGNSGGRGGVDAGGGGGGGNSAPATGGNGGYSYFGGAGGGGKEGGYGGSSVWGGGGGGGDGAISGGGGSSKFGGNGGATSSAGTAPGGGGGSNAAGARGECRVRILG